MLNRYCTLINTLAYVKSHRKNRNHKVILAQLLHSTKMVFAKELS